MTTRLRPADYRIDPFDLRLFTTVIDTGTITAASARLGLSLAAASTRVKALEAQVGARLLDRSKTGASPTDAGRALARRAHMVLAELETLHLEMSGFAGGMRGRIRVLANTSAIVEALPQVLGRFLREHPDLDIDLRELPSEAVLEALREGAADLGIVASHVDAVGLVTHAWLEDPLVAVLPDSADTAEAFLSLTSDPGLGLATLLDHPFVGLPTDSGLSRFLAQQARQSGRLPHHRVRVSSIDAVMRLVAAGVGVAVLPLHAAQRWVTEGVRLVPLQDAWARRQLRVCLEQAASQRPAVQALVNALLAERSQPHDRER